MKTEIFNKASRVVGRAGLQIKKHSPEILMVAGIVGTVASTVLACKATTKVSKILDERKKDLDLIHKGAADGQINGKEYTEEDCKKDLTIVYAQSSFKLVKLYTPAAILGTLSIASIVSGHTILKKRNIALAAAYAVVDKGFKDYRNNVVERFGEAIDKELRYNIKAKEIEEIVVDENGNEKVEKSIVQSMENQSIAEHSEYARFFDEFCKDWRKDAEYNLMFLRRMQDWANEKLKAKGHLFLNEVYDMLDIPRSVAGQSVGWVYNEKNPNGDNYVDFGIYVNNEGNRLFVNGRERSILLDFNVDGNILNLI